MNDFPLSGGSVTNEEDSLMRYIPADIPFAIDERELSPGPYPPYGFLALPETDFGNGDCFGLWWVPGREHLPPVVCELYHDEWRVAPVFSCAAKLAEWYELNDDADEDDCDDPQTVEDSLFAPALYEQGKVFRAEGKTADAIRCLRAACDSFPDISEYWLTLANLCQQSGDKTGAAHAALNGYLANWCFGIPGDKVLWFLKQAAGIDALRDDPVVRRVASGVLTLNFGGVKENPNYPLMQACIDDYIKLNNPMNAQRLSHNYAFAMYGETTAFQARYHFSLSEWQKQFRALCSA